jgi:hypothetical protein
MATRRRCVAFAVYDCRLRLPGGDEEMAEPDRTSHTETDIKAYQGYMLDEWGEKTIAPISEGTVLA